MYIPPQQDKFGLDSPVEPKFGHHTYFYTPQGLGRKEKRENWIWKTCEPKPHRLNTNINRRKRDQQLTEAFSYEYVMEDGRLATIAEKHPETPVEYRQRHSNTQSEVLLNRRRFVKHIKSASIAGRHSAPAVLTSSKAGEESRVSTEEAAVIKLKRALFLSSPTKAKAAHGKTKDMRKPLPPIPAPSNPLTTSTEKSFGLIGSQCSVAAASHQTSKKTSGPELDFDKCWPLSSHPPDCQVSLASPRIAESGVVPLSSPSVLSATLPPSPPRSFEFSLPRKSKILSVTSNEPAGQQYGLPPTPPATPPSIPESYEDVLFEPLAYSRRTANDRRSETSTGNSLPGGPYIRNLEHSPERAMKTLQAATTSPQQQQHWESSLADWEISQLQETRTVKPMSDKRAEAGHSHKRMSQERSQSPVTTNERRPQEMRPALPAIFTAELRPVLSRRIVATGTAKLVKC